MSMTTPAEKLLRVLAHVNSNADQNEAANAARVADDRVRRDNLYQEVPIGTKVWLILSDTGLVLWRFSRFTDAEVTAVPGTRRWLGQVPLNHHVTFADDNGMLRVVPVTSILSKDLSKSHNTPHKVWRWVRPVGVFLTSGWVVAVSKTSLMCRFWVSCQPSSHNQVYMPLAARDEVLRAQAIRNATNVCLVTGTGLALTFPMSQVLVRPKRAMKLDRNDRVLDLRLVEDPYKPLRFNLEDGAVECVPVRHAGHHSDRGTPIRPPPEPLVWVSDVWDADARAGRAMTLDAPLMRLAAQAHVVFNDISALLRDYWLTPARVDRMLPGGYRDSTIAGFLSEAVLLAKALDAEARDACIDALLGMSLFDFPADGRGRALLTIFAREPATFCALSMLLCPRVPLDMIAKSYQDLTKNTLPPVLVEIVSHKLKERVLT